MGVPASQALKVATHLIRQRLKGVDRYPLVLMLEPLFRCNLACAGCGKVQYPAHVLRRDLPLDRCLAAASECGAPIVSIAGGEPLLHPEIDDIVEGLIDQGRYVYLCTNAMMLKKKLEEGGLTPSKQLTLSIHIDGPEYEHDFSVCRSGAYQEVASAIEDAVRRGFRVTTNTTLFDNADPEHMRAFFDDMMSLGVEGMTISPGYSYSKAPLQESFLARKKTQGLFRQMLTEAKRSWRFNHSPLFLRFLTGEIHLECRPWGNPTYNIFGWQKPCYLLQEGYVETFAELMADTAWDTYGKASGNEKCADCMVHCGHEPSAVHEMFSPRMLLRLLKPMA